MDRMRIRGPQFASVLNVVRVLIVDSHPIVRRGYQHLLSKELGFEVCGEAESVSQALRLAREMKPDLAIVDIALPDGNGIDSVKRLIAQQPKLRVLIASAHDEELFAERALRAGALGFISKRAAIDHLITALSRVLQGEVYLSDRMSRRCLRRTVGSDDKCLEDPVAHLTNRELEAFQFLGEGLATREIARRMDICPKTVDRYRENIKRKLQVSHASDLIRRATQFVLENR